MSIAEQIYELVKALPPDEASEILDFAESVRARHLSADKSTGTAPQEAWIELVESLAGSWGEDFPKLEDIRAVLGQDILRESL
jgi:hypothetical protein